MNSTLLMRLDIVKFAISIDDQQLVYEQLQKLKELTLDENAEHIVNLIESFQFKDVIQLIELYKKDNSSLVIFEDPKIQGLRAELKILEDRVNELSDEKIEYERIINNFNSEHMLRLGSVIEEILRLRAQLENSSIDEQVAQQEYHSFHNSYQQQLKNLPEHLTVNEKKILKSAYRRASRLCHPDKLVGEYKAKGEEIFKELNDAYRQQNLQMLEEILTSLESGLVMNVASDYIDDIALLQKRVAVLRGRISMLEDEIYTLGNSDILKRIQSIEDTDKYFSELKKELEMELTQLRGENEALFYAHE